MLTVSDLEDDVKRVLGGCGDAEFYSRLNDAVEILSTEGEWDPSRGYVDVVITDEHLVTLPREVGTVMSVNYGGYPGQLHNFWFQFHLNGPGQNHCAVPGIHTMDELPVCVFRDPDDEVGNKLVLSLEDENDAGIAFRVYGYTAAGVWIRSLEGGVYVDGFLVPTDGTDNPSAPLIAKITRIKKPVTLGVVTLSILNNDASTTAIGKYFPKDKNPTYRRLKLTRSAENKTVRIGFRKLKDTLSALDDLIPLHSKYAIVLMVKALKKFDEDRPDEGAKYRYLALGLLKQKQISVEVPDGPSIQIADGNLIADKFDRME